MRDYIIKVNDIVPFRTALAAAAEVSDWAYLEEGTGEAKVNLPITGIIAQVGPSTASICRLNDDQLSWFLGITQVSKLGEAKVDTIQSIDDINWEPSGMGLYHSIHIQTPYDVVDGEGETITVTPPLLHCILAS